MGVNEKVKGMERPRGRSRGKWGGKGEGDEVMKGIERRGNRVINGDDTTDDDGDALWVRMGINSWQTHFFR